MLAAIPSAHPALAQADADAKSAETATLNTEVQQDAIFLHHQTASGGAWFFQSGLCYREFRGALRLRR